MVEVLLIIAFIIISIYHIIDILDGNLSKKYIIIKIFFIMINSIGIMFNVLFLIIQATP